MSEPIPDPSLRLLHSIFELGAEHASRALTTWLGRSVLVAISRVNQADLTDVVGLLGPEDELLGSVIMELGGRLSGQLLLVFHDRDGLAMADMVLRQPIGSMGEWDDLSRSAALETANIVGCALLNSLSSHLPIMSGSGGASIVPSPPIFRHEYAGSLLQFALMDQAVSADRVLLVESRFEAEGEELRWSLLFIPSAASMADLSGLGGS